MYVRMHACTCAHTCMRACVHALGTSTCRRSSRLRRRCRLMAPVGVARLPRRGVLSEAAVASPTLQRRASRCSRSQRHRLQQYTHCKVSLHSRCTVAAQSLRSRCTVAAQSLHSRCTVAAQSLHSRCTVAAQTHSHCTATAHCTIGAVSAKSLYIATAALAPARQRRGNLVPSRIAPIMIESQ